MGLGCQGPSRKATPKFSMRPSPVDGNETFLTRSFLYLISFLSSVFCLVLVSFLFTPINLVGGTISKEKTVDAGYRVHGMGLSSVKKIKIKTTSIPRLVVVPAEVIIN